MLLKAELVYEKTRLQNCSKSMQPILTNSGLLFYYFITIFVTKYETWVISLEISKEFYLVGNLITKLLGHSQNKYIRNKKNKEKSWFLSVFGGEVIAIII